MFFPNARIIFALTTPVIETLAPLGWGRYNREIEAYNDAAKQVMQKLGVETNDLYVTAKDFDESFYADWTHFNEKGAQILADKVVEIIGKDDE